MTNRLYHNSLRSRIVIYGSGLQSDAEYAEAFARSRWRLAIWGPQRLKQVRISTKQDQKFCQPLKVRVAHSGPQGIIPRGLNLVLDILSKCV